MKKIFISGSMSIKTLSKKIKASLELLTQKEYKILIGDAPGIDGLIQEFLAEKKYFYVYVYSISNPRILKSPKFHKNKVKFDENITDGRERQTQKDIFMTKQCDISFVIWDGKSKGSYNNIIRSLELGKEVQVFYKNLFLKEEEKTIENITSIYKENHMYSLSEYLKEEKENLNTKTSKKMKEILQNQGILIGKTINTQYKDDIDFKLNRGKKIFIYKKSLLDKYFYDTSLPQNALF